ncbi:phosphate ABC transporter substrate-binding protein [Glaciimonas sp. Cout2]|uniref:phosphate ABC transporter substrate-binding protein n=2 Tax=unclassified Glaciimonas TaxID=2644401 RepID=UPI002B22CD57|nr:phosphate ABC transporter substrate-binding protein [Glaciimonas sp. Cout2]MEB0011132.1 phosphate ABC transporter substrate-binding protein [Glaciimonas sp. Cout2]
MTRLFIPTLLMIFFITVFLTACNRQNATDDSGANGTAPAGSVLKGHLLITGSSTTAPLMAQIVKRYQLLHPNVNIRIEMGGAERGITDTRNGIADIGMVSRLVTDEDVYLKGFPVARDGAGLIIHKSNPVTSLTSSQITDIFRGRIKNWKKVGGVDAPIMVINREEGRGTVVLFMHHFKMNYSEMKAEQVLGENADVIDAVAASSNAISLMSVIVAEDQIRGSVPIKILSVDGIAATQANIFSGDYPLTRPLMLVTRGLPQGLAKKLIEYSLSPQVADIIDKMGFVPYQE